MGRSLVVGFALAIAFAVASGASGGGAGWPKPDARDRALLASVLHGMKTELQTVRLTQLPAMWRDEKRHGTLELVTTTSATRNAASTRADWDTWLVAHAYNERCIRSAHHCVSVDRGPNVGGPAGRSGAERPFWSSRALAHEIRRRFAAVHLSRTSVAFEHPYAFAPIVTVRSSHPRRAYQAEQKAWLALLPALRHTEGSFVQMFDARGRVFYLSAGSGNTGTGWCAPYLGCAHL